MRDVSGDLAENPLLALVRTGIENDFEEVVFSQHPSLRSTKRDLMGSSEIRTQLWVLRFMQLFRVLVRRCLDCISHKQTLSPLNIVSNKTARGQS